MTLLYIGPFETYRVSSCEASTIYNIHMSVLDRIKQRHIRDQVHRVSAIIVIANDDREINVVLEDNRLRLLRVPLWPGDPQAILPVRVEVIDESDDIVLQLPLCPKRRFEIHRMGLEGRYQLYWGH